MMNRNNLKGNWPMMIGAIGMFVYFGVGHFVALPEGLRGFLLGLSTACLLYGAIAAKFGFERFRDWKKSLLQRIK